MVLLKTEFYEQLIGMNTQTHITCSSKSVKLCELKWHEQLKKKTEMKIEFYHIFDSFPVLAADKKNTESIEKNAALILMQL